MVGGKSIRNMPRVLIRQLADGPSAHINAIRESSQIDTNGKPLDKCQEIPQKTAAHMSDIVPHAFAVKIAYLKRPVPRPVSLGNHSRECHRIT